LKIKEVCSLLFYLLANDLLGDIFSDTGDLLSYVGDIFDDLLVD
jgi:hypothetical protein